MPIWWVGRKHTEATKAKMSAARTGSNNPFFGRSHTEQTKQKLRSSKIGKATRSGPHTEATKAKISRTRIAAESAKGSKNPNWRGGVSNSRKSAMATTAYKEWRKSVFTRDDFTCRTCNQHGGDLEAYHIKPWAYFPEFRYEVSNGRTLCVLCHRKTFKGLNKCRNQQGAVQVVGSE